MTSPRRRTRRPSGRLRVFKPRWAQRSVRIAFKSAASGQVQRNEVERIVRERQRTVGPGVPLSAGDQRWLDEPHAAAAAVVIEPRVRAGARIAPDANLELDLGLDSLERVELVAELEQRFQVAVPDHAASEIFTVRQLVEAVRPIDKPSTFAQGAAADRSDPPGYFFLRASISLAASEMATTAGCFNRRSTEMAK